MNFCRLAISNEIQEELKRTAQDGKTDPMLGFVDIFSSFPLSKKTKCDDLIQKLAVLVFPEKHKNSQLSENDISDLRHLATVIQNDLAGLITNDSFILEAAPKVKNNYGIEVISPDAFILDESMQSDNTSYITSENATLSLLDISEGQEDSVRSLLSKFNLSGLDLSSGWFPTRSQGSIASRYAVWDKDSVVGYMTWSKGRQEASINARIAVDETDPGVLNAVRILLIYMLEQQSSHGPRKITLELVQHQPSVREIATEFGFRGTPNEQFLTKLVFGGVFTTGHMEGWTKTTC